MKERETMVAVRNKARTGFPRMSPTRYLLFMVSTCFFLLQSSVLADTIHHPHIVFRPDGLPDGLGATSGNDALTDDPQFVVTPFATGTAYFEHDGTDSSTTMKLYSGSTLLQTESNSDGKNSMTYSVNAGTEYKLTEDIGVLSTHYSMYITLTSPSISQLSLDIQGNATVTNVTLSHSTSSWFRKYVAPASGSLYVEADVNPNSATRDTDLFIFNSSYQKLFEDLGDDDGDCTINVTAGQTYYILVRQNISDDYSGFTFDLIVDGPAPPEISVSGNSVIITDGDTTPSSSDGTDFGSVQQGQSGPTRTFTVVNVGGLPLTLGTVSVPTGYTLTEGLSSSLAVGASDTFTVRLDTATAGTKSGQISFSNNDSDENPFNFSVTGTVTPPPAEITVLGNGVSITDGDTTPGTSDGTDFGTVQQGQPGLTRTFTVRNDGGSTLTLGTVSVPTGYTLTEGLSSSLAVGASDTFTVRLDTATAGTKSGQISFSNNDSDENPFNFSVTGTVVAGAEVTSLITLTGSDIPNNAIVDSFGSVVQGQQGPKMKFTVRNDGGSTLNLSNLTVPTGFTVVEGLALSLAPGASDTFEVQLASAITGTKTGWVSFNTNDSDENPFRFTISGNVFVPQYGVTVITHGYVPGSMTATNSWLSDMGVAVLNRAGKGRLWLFDVWNDTLTDVTDSQHTYDSTFQKDNAGQRTGEQVIIVDWQNTANNTFETAAGHAEAVGHALYSLLMGGESGEIGFVGSPSARKPLHFIGHSFGAVVVSEAIQRLGLQGIEVEQMTTLDPHDWDEQWIFLDVDGKALTPDVHVWSNVVRADNYYTTLGGGAADCPHGRPISGAQNYELTWFDGFYNGLVAAPHSRVHAYYQGTIDPEQIGSNDIFDTWYPSLPSRRGYSYSRIGGSNYLSDFSDEGHGSDSLTSPPANSTRSNYNGQTDISMDPPEKIFNGDFRLAQYGSGAGYTDEFFQDNWYGTPLNDGNYARRLDILNDQISTHLTYVPADATYLRFKVFVSLVGGWGGDDTLHVYFDDDQLGTPITVSQSGGFVSFTRDVTAYRAKSGVFTFDLNGNGILDSIVWLDDLEFIRPEMDILGNDQSIADGDATPSTADDTDFGSADLNGGVVSHWFAIKNTGSAQLALTGTAKVQISGSSDFTIVSQPVSPVGANGGITSFQVRFDPSGTGLRTAIISIPNDDADENPYNFSIQGTGISTVTLSINDVTVVEGNSGSVNAVFTVNLSQASSGTVTVNYATASGTASSVSDYTATSGTLTFTPGQTSKQISVSVNGDTNVEPDETFFVNLSSASGATIADSRGEGTIQNDDVAMTRIISVSGNLAFGDTTVGTTAQRTLTIYNTGNSILNVSSNSYPSGFSGVWSGNISAGGSHDVIVTFAPTAATSYGGTVTVYSDATSGTSTISISGTGIPTQTVATPTISPPGGLFTNSVQVTLACSTVGAAIRYTTNGSDPTTNSTAYISPFTLTSSATVKAKAFLSGYNDSEIAPASFTITSTADLLAHWKFDEGSGALAFDSSGNANTGAVINATWTSGRVNSALNFDGTSSQVTVANSPTLNPTTAITLAAWINGDYWALKNARVVEKGQSENQYQLYCANGQLRFFLDLGGVKSELVATTTFLAGVWYHVAGTYDGASIRLYVDGELQGQQSASGNIQTSTDILAIGNRPVEGSDIDHFKGVIDDVRIYGRALSASEVAALNSGALLTINTSSSPVVGGSTSGGGNYTSNATVTVTATVTNSCYSFVNWTEAGTNVSATTSYSFPATRNRALVANFSQISYTITTSASPLAGGTTGGGGSKACGSSVTVTAAPTNGYTFLNWTESSVQVSTSANYTFTASANRTLVANFSPVPTYTIATSSSPVVGGSTSGGGNYTSNATVTVTATVTNSCYSFVNWTEAGTNVSATTSYSFPATRNRALVANFSQISYTITTSSSPLAGGTTGGGGSKLCGSSVTVTATANAGYNFVNWTESSVQVSTSANYTFTASANRTLVANFSPVPTYTIATSSSPVVGGSTSGGGNYASNATVTVTATVTNSCYSFVNWTEAGTNVSATTSYSFPATRNRALVANFSQISYTITTSASPLAGGTTGGGGSKACGSSVTVTAAPTNGYTFLNWTESTVPVSANASYTFTASANRTLVANFATTPPVNHPPVITGLTVSNALMQANGVAVTAVDDPLYFTVAATDPDGDPLSYLWTFCDGTTNSSQAVAHTLTNCGPCLVNAVVSDGQAVTGSNLTVSVPCLMTVTNMQVKLSFSKPNADSCKLKAVPQPNQCTNWLGTAVTLDVGGAQVSWKLDVKGRGVSTNGTCRFAYNQKTGTCTFTGSLLRGNWRAPWATHGLVNDTVPKPGNEVTLPVILLIGDDAYMFEKPLHYTATRDKSGTAK